MIRLTDDSMLTRADLAHARAGGPAVMYIAPLIDLAPRDVESVPVDLAIPDSSQSILSESRIDAILSVALATPVADDPGVGLLEVAPPVSDPAIDDIVAAPQGLPDASVDGPGDAPAAGHNIDWSAAVLESQHALSVGDVIGSGAAIVDLSGAIDAALAAPFADGSAAGVAPELADASASQFASFAPALTDDSVFFDHFIF